MIDRCDTAVSRGPANDHDPKDVIRDPTQKKIRRSEAAHDDDDNIRHRSSPAAQHSQNQECDNSVPFPRSQDVPNLQHCLAAMR